MHSCTILFKLDQGSQTKNLAFFPTPSLCMIVSNKPGILLTPLFLFFLTRSAITI